MVNRLIYLDHAAATPLDPQVFEAMRPFLDGQSFYNPSAAYGPAREVKTALNEARHRLAMVIGAKQTEIVLTAGATESINLGLYGIMAGTNSNMVIGATEHQAVRAAASRFELRLAPADRRGLVSVDSIKKQIDDNTRLISLTMADGELGTVQPVKQVAALVQGIREERRSRGVKTPLYLHSDGSQAAGQLDINVARLGVDLLTLNAAKCYGPKQAGLLYVKTGLQLKPLILGGGQERGLRSGTENVAAAVGFALSLELAEARRSKTIKQLTEFRQLLAAKLQNDVQGLVVNGHPKKHLPGILNVSLPGLDAERVVYALDSQGVFVSTGAACAANKGTRSEVLIACGLNSDETDGSLRFSFGRGNDLDEIERAVKIISDTIGRERGL